MIGVLTEYSAHKAEIPRKGPAVGLFVDQEIKLINGPCSLITLTGYSVKLFI